MSDLRSAGIILGALALFLFLFCLAIIIFVVVIRWKLFEKAGKPGWASIVPIYSEIIMLEIAGYEWYYIFYLCLGVIPVIGALALTLFAITYKIKTAKSFGQGIGFGIGLWLLPIIFEAIIVFNKDINYVGPAVNGNIDFNDLF